MVQDEARSRKCNISLAIRVKLRSQREQQVNGRRTLSGLMLSWIYLHKTNPNGFHLPDVGSDRS